MGISLKYQFSNDQVSQYQKGMYNFNVHTSIWTLRYCYSVKNQLSASRLKVSISTK